MYSVPGKGPDVTDTWGITGAGGYKVTVSSCPTQVQVSCDWATIPGDPKPVRVRGRDGHISVIRQEDREFDWMFLLWDEGSGSERVKWEVSVNPNARSERELLGFTEDLREIR